MSSSTETFTYTATGDFGTSTETETETFSVSAADSGTSSDRSSSMSSPSSATTPSVTPGPNRGPLTTTFTPPTSCLSTVTLVTTNGQTSYYYGHYGTGDTACYPPATLGSLAAGSSGWEPYWYSPGVHCPEGWTDAATLADGWEGLTLHNFKQTQGATSGVLCCPSGLLFGGTNNLCVGEATAGQPLARIYSPNGDTARSTTIRSAASVTVNGIPILCQAKDLTPTPTATDGEQYPGEQDPPQGSSHHGLSLGAQIGIGVVFGVLGVLGIAAFIWRMRRRFRREDRRREGMTDYPRAAKRNKDPTQPEADGNPMSELASQEHVGKPDQTTEWHEAPGHEPEIAELP